MLRVSGRSSDFEGSEAGGIAGAQGWVSELDRTRALVFTDSDFGFLRDFVAERTGIVLSDAKREMVYGRLSRRIRELKLGSFGEYCSLIRNGSEQEAEQLTNLITTNVTSFFREPHHFEFLEFTVLPDLMKERAPSRRIRIWSAGCSSGEEPYSIGMVVLDVLGSIQDWDIKILATDLDRTALEKARAGMYSEERVVGISEERRLRWFTRDPSSTTAAFRVSPKLSAMIQFNPLNLMHEWPMRGIFDVIFCRNVVIYFDKSTQAALFDRYAEVLSDAGHLFIGHSETLHRLSTRFRPVGRCVYQKVSTE